MQGINDRRWRSATYDPRVTYDQIKDLNEFKEKNNSVNGSEGSWEVFESFIVMRSLMIVIMTEWEEFKFIDWEEVSIKMRKPFWVFDTRAILDTKEVGINIWSIGCGE